MLPAPVRKLRADGKWVWCHCWGCESGPGTESLHPLFIVPRFVVQEPREAVPVLLKEIYKMPSR